MWSLAFRPLIEALFRQDCGEVVDVQAVSHACARYTGKDWSDLPVAVIIAGDGIVKNADSADYRMAMGAQLNDLVAVFCFASVSVMHKM
ncbi:hypothetical protein [Prosthecobacter sp.]|uniref:hypothetical protein n=1 Tax=Prosthecobacter sp. TaxID=1965333 RepID=UPI003782FC60